MNNFNEMTMEEMMELEAGGVKQAAQVFCGVVLVGASPAVGVATSIVSTPVGGAVAAGGVAGIGFTLIGAGNH